MEIVAFYECQNLLEAKTKEQEHYITLNGTLNAVNPLAQPKIKYSVNNQETINKFYCKLCNYNTSRKRQYDNHLLTHNPNINLDVNSNIGVNLPSQPAAALPSSSAGINANKLNTKTYYCEKCEFTCYKESNWLIHILTAKHSRKINGNNIVAVIAKPCNFICKNCSKKYNSNSGLWKHNIKCKSHNNDSTNNLIIDLIKQNTEFKDLIVEQNKQLSDQNNKLIKLFQKENNTIIY